MIATPQDVTEYQEVVMSCIYKKKYFGVTDNERFLLLLHQMSSGYMQNLAWESQPEKQKGRKKAYVSFTEVISWKARFCPLYMFSDMSVHFHGLVRVINWSQSLWWIVFYRIQTFWVTSNKKKAQFQIVEEYVCKLRSWKECVQCTTIFSAVPDFQDLTVTEISNWLNITSSLRRCPWGFQGVIVSSQMQQLAKSSLVQSSKCVFSSMAL